MSYYTRVLISALWTFDAEPTIRNSENVALAAMNLRQEMLERIDAILSTDKRGLARMLAKRDMALECIALHDNFVFGE